jgi:hypothetical protein
MITRLLKQYDIYKNADEMPIWNFYQICVTNDYRYMLKKHDVKIDNKLLQKLKTAANNLIYTLSRVNYKLLALYTSAYAKFLLYITDTNSDTEQAYCISFNEYLNELKKEHQEITEQYNEKKKNTSDIEVFYAERLAEFAISNYIKKIEKKWDLNAECANLELILKKDINIFTTSVNKYFEYRLLAEKIIKIKERQNEKN